MSRALALLAGALFGSGLIVSGMADPARVLAFLDVGGDWNPGLAFVMASALAVAAPAYAWARRHRPQIAATLPARWPPDARLIAGAVLFGLGWGLSGLCPGPALVGAAGGALPMLAFVAAMAAGMRLSAMLRRHIDRR